MPDIRRMGATMLAYTGKVLNYILATPPSPDDASSPLELALGNEASEADIRAFARRFDCKVRDSYGSTEGIIIIRRDCVDAARARSAPPTTTSRSTTPRRASSVRPRGSTPTAASSTPTRPSVRSSTRTSARRFEGYYKNEEALASKVRDGIYWSGDLAYRDEDGWFYFAGRSNEWLRVDGENFAAAPVERIVARHPHVRSVAVYAVPDERVGDSVMVAIEVDDPDAFDVEELDAFLAMQRDLGTKWVPELRARGRGAAEAREHEGGQDPPAP